MAAGCGRGLFIGRVGNADATPVSPDTYIPPPDAPAPGQDGLTPDPDGSSYDASNTATVLVDPNGAATITLGEATLTFGPGSFQTPGELVTMQRIPTIGHTGAIGAVFQVSVPSVGLVHEDPTLTIQVPTDVPSSEAQNLGLAALDPSQSTAKQQWTPLQSPTSTQDQGQTTISAHASGLESTATLDYALVIPCTTNGTACPNCMACTSQACQQCPTDSPCTCG